jgi:hypothetical protein
MPPPTRPNGYQRDCSSCGAPAEWLVTARYSPEQRAGRLLVYCDKAEHRVNFATHLGVIIPLGLLDEDPNEVLTFLYEDGYTLSNPDLAADVIGVPAGPWQAKARAVIANSEASP